jgi:integrase
MQKVWHRASNSSWYVTFTEDGRQKQRKLLSGPNDKAHKKLAEQKMLEELKVRPPSQKKSAPDWLTVRGVLKAFLRHSRKNHEPSTYDWYKNFFKSLAGMYGRLRVSELAKKHVKRWLAKAGYNPTSQNRGVGALQCAFNWAVEEEHIIVNPIAHVKKPKGLVRDRILTAAERELILSSIKGPAFREFVQGMTLTGCRPGEVARVNREIVNLDAGLWVFTKHKTVKKTGKPRVVYLCPQALDLTRKLLAKTGGTTPSSKTRGASRGPATLSASASATFARNTRS